MAIDLPASLRSDVRLLDRDSAAETAKADAASATAAWHQSAADGIHATMNRRERWLWPWLSKLLGGDPDKVKRHSAELTLSAQFNETAAKHVSAHKNCEKRVEKILDDHLRADDADYRALVVPYDASRTMMAEIEKFKSSINKAMREIDDAQSAEIMDIATPKSNKGMKMAMSMRSHMETQEAKEAVRAVNSAVPAFQQAAARYSEELKGFSLPKVNTDMMSTTDLIFDMALGGMDFTSFFALSALQSSEDGLKNAKQKITAASDVVQDNLNKATQARNEYLNSARALCV